VASFNAQRVITQCVVQLELITAVGCLADAHLASLHEAHVNTLLELLQGSAAFARKFNADRPLRRALWDGGLMRFARANKLPSLLRQETAATQQLLILLLRLYTGSGPAAGAAAAAPAGAAAAAGSGDWRALALSHLRSLATGMVARFSALALEAERARLLATPAWMQASVSLGTLAPQAGAGGAGGAGDGGDGDGASHLLDGSGAIDRDLFRESAAMGPLVGVLLEGLLTFNDAQFQTNLHWLYPILTGLIVAGGIELRVLVRNVFDQRIAPLIRGAAPPPSPTPTPTPAAAAAK
jgi:hypothetical protein